MENCDRCGAPRQASNIELPICLECSEALNTNPQPIPNEVQLGLPHD